MITLLLAVQLRDQRDIEGVKLGLDHKGSHTQKGKRGENNS